VVSGIHAKGVITLLNYPTQCRLIRIQTHDRDWIDSPEAVVDTLVMSSLALEIDRALLRLAPEKAARLEKLVRDSLALALADEESGASPVEATRRQAWLERLEALRASIGTGNNGSSTESILEDLRSDRE
jgi:hypothetical protein